MKETFFEHYSPTDEEINSIWQDCYLSLDANVLLNLYRYTDSTRNDFFKVLKGYQDKLILTYQAGKEYHKHRLTAINSQLKSYDSLIDFLDKKSNEIEAELNKHKKHSYIDTIKIKKSINAGFAKNKKDITSLKEGHPNLFTNDPIKEFITELFDKKVTLPYSDEKLSSIYKEGKHRYEKQIPPGYKDYAEKKNNEESSLYGDLIIWCQIIDFAKDNGKPIIFVTDDLKEDWWDKFNGETKGPRVELLKEFYEKSKQKILIYNPDSFLRFAKDKMGAEIGESTIDEINDIRNEDQLKLKIQLRDSVGMVLDNFQKMNKIDSNVINQNNLIRNTILNKNDLSESEISDLFTYIFKVESKRQAILNSAFHLDFIDTDFDINNLTTEQILNVRRLLDFYKRFGNLDDDSLKLLS